MKVTNSYQVTVKGQRSSAEVKVNPCESVDKVVEKSNNDSNDCLLVSSSNDNTVNTDDDSQEEEIVTLHKINATKEKSVIPQESNNIPVSSIPVNSVTENKSEAMSQSAKNRTSETGSDTKSKSQSTKAGKTVDQSSSSNTVGAESPVRLRKKSSSSDLEVFKGKSL